MESYLRGRERKAPYAVLSPDARVDPVLCVQAPSWVSSGSRSVSHEIKNRRGPYPVVAFVDPRCHFFEDLDSL